MADITLTEAQIAVVYPGDALITHKVLAEAVTAGQTLCQNTSGQAAIADANAAGLQQVRYMALQNGGAGESIRVLQHGHVYGFDLSAQTFDDPLFQSDTAGTVADAAGTLSVPVGIVEGVANDGVIKKVLYFDPRTREDYA